jgi:cell division protein FtsW
MSKVNASSEYRSFLQSPAAPLILIAISVSSLATLGLLMVLSASSISAYETSGDTYSIFIKQLLFTILGVAFLFLGTRKKTKLWDWLTKNSLWIGIGLLAAPLSPIGKVVNGNRSWIGKGSFSMQPSELGKLLLVLWLANQITLYKNRRSAGQSVNPIGMTMLAPALFIGLVMLGSDLGTAGIYGAVTLVLIYLTEIPNSTMAGITLLGAAIATGFVISAPYRVQRFLVVLNPFASSVYHDAGWQPAHSLMGLASGGFFGVGLGASKQKWANLGEAHTDFIFSVIGEELGLIGTILVLVLFVILIYAIFRIAINAKEMRDKYIATGIGAWFFFQALINMGTALSIFPVVGVTLPFISYGGSSLISTYLGIAVVIYIARKDESYNLTWKFRK